MPARLGVVFGHDKEYPDAPGNLTKIFALGKITGGPRWHATVKRGNSLQQPAKFLPQPAQHRVTWPHNRATHISRSATTSAAGRSLDHVFPARFPGFGGKFAAHQFEG